MYVKSQITHPRHTLRKYLSVILCISCFFIVPVFAQENTSPTLDNLQKILQQFISLMSRGWVVLAGLAGKFMTNDFVFGAALHMDVYLWKIWNIMKNFANFILIGMIIVPIIKGLIGKQNIEAKSIITKALVAGILIQASRFIMGALIDVSTIAVSAIGSFPSTFMSNDPKFAENMDTYMNKLKKVRIDIDGSKSDPTKVAKIHMDDAATTSNDDVLESILPTANSLGGPLIFLGMSTFRFYEYLRIADPDVQSLAIGFSLKSVVLVMYSIGLLLLLIANIIRVAFLWLFIIGSPFIVLFQVFQTKGSGDVKKITERFGLGAVMDVVFKPVIFMAMMSLILILVISMQNIMVNDPLNSVELNGVTMSVNPSSTNSTATMAIQGVSTVTVHDNLFQDMGNTSKNIFADLILFFVTIFLVRELIKLSLTTGEGPISKAMKPLTKFAENMATHLPVIGGRSFYERQKMGKDVAGYYAEEFGLDPKNRESGKLRKDNDATNKVRKALGLGGGWMSTDFAKLDKAIASGAPGDFWSMSRDIAADGDNTEGLSINVSGGSWKTRMETRLKKYAGTGNSLGFKGSFTNLETFLKGDTPNQINNRWVLFDKMGGETANPKLKGFKEATPPSYEQLMEAQYYLKK